MEILLFIIALALLPTALYTAVYVACSICDVIYFTLNKVINFIAAYPFLCASLAIIFLSVNL